MNYIIAHNILSPLGSTTAENYLAVRQGVSGIKEHEMPSLGRFYASMFADRESLMIEGYSFFESLCIRSINSALQSDTNLDLSQSDTVFIVSSTKGNVEDLAVGKTPSLPLSAEKIARHFGNTEPAIVVSNACISGVCAQITAARLLKEGKYKHCVIVGSDVLSPFIVSGFGSLKALSDAPCMPFDARRSGLNLGEAAATMILSSDERFAPFALGSIRAGSIHNDANHISGPSRTGEGSFRCLEDIKPDTFDDLAFVNVHGTATLYNDEMESIALTRADLQGVPVNGYKGYYGHTLGAAGLVETVLSLYALQQGTILPMRGYEQQGTTNQLNIATQVLKTNKRQFIKLLSGFGGCNAAILVDGVRIQPECEKRVRTQPECDFAAGWQPAYPQQEVIITTDSITVNGTTLPMRETGEAMLTEAYRAHINDYPKYFKMDTLARLGFVASELLLQAAGEERFVARADRAIVLANNSSCLQNDTEYQKTIADADNFFPSPALFVYTLPNIVTGEIAIRNKYFGETSFYLLKQEDDLPLIADLAFQQPQTTSAIVGWVECRAKNDFYAHLMLVESQKSKVKSRKSKVESRNT